jgi:type VI secretion system protein ImpL
LAAALRDSPFAPPPASPAGQSVWWRWWLGERLAAAEMAPFLLARRKAIDGWDAMERALGLLARHDAGGRIGGYALALSAESLAARPDYAGETAFDLATIAVEVAATLRWQAPMHLVITGLQAVPGHDAFFSALPAPAGAQPLGLRLPSDDDGKAAERVQAWLGALVSRLRRVRLGLLLSGPAEANRAEAFRFFEALPALGPGLAAAAEAIAEAAPGPGYSAGTHLRSVYLTAPGAAARHLEDVVDRFIVADAGLAGPV